MANAIETRNHNILAVVKAIHAQPGIAKPRICKECDLAASTVQGIVAQLLEQGMITCLGSADSTGGRKAHSYSINPGHRFILAVSMRIHRVDIGVLNLGLELLHHRELALTLDGTGPETYVAALLQEMQTLLPACGIPRDQIIGIGISVPGPTDFKTGIVREISGASMWSDFPLGGRIASVMQLPVWVDKDAYMGVQYLLYSGEIQKGRSVVYVNVREGIGAALMIDGKVFRGSHSLAGEIGHVTVRRDGARCHCGNAGCLELYCSDTGIVAQYNAQGEENCGHIDEIIGRSEAGDEIAQRVFVQALRYLAVTTSNIIMNYDPGEIILDCRWLHKQKALYFSLLDGLYAKSIFIQKHAVNLRLLEPQDFYLYSAAAAVGSDYLFSEKSPLLASVD